MLYPNIDSVLELFSKNEVIIFTNGTMYNENVLNIIAKHNFGLQISIHCYNNKTEMEIRNVKAQDILENIKRIKNFNHNIEITVNYVVNKINVEEINDITKWLIKHDIKSIIFTPIHIGKMNNETFNRFGFSILEKKDVFNYLHKLKEMYSDKINIIISGENYFHSLFKKNILSCQKIIEEVLNKENGYFEICSRLKTYHECVDCNFTLDSFMKKDDEGYQLSER